MSSFSKAAPAAAALILAGCSGGDSGSDSDRVVYTIDAVPYRVDGMEGELDLSDPDAVLAAALSAVEVSAAVLVGDLNNLYHGSAPPGRGDIACNAGSLRETVAEAAGERQVTLNASQCFDRNSDGVQDGIVDLAYSQPAAAKAEGTLVFGSDTSSFLIGLSEADDVDYRFRQARGQVAFSGDVDGSPATSTVSGLSVIFGKGARPTTSGGVFTPSRSIEVLAGTTGNELNVTGSNGSGSTNVDLSGRFFISGIGATLDPSCAFEASFDAITNRTMQIGSTDTIIRDGLLTVSTSAGSSTVEFDASGNARVDLGVGTPQSYPVSIVRSFCVF